MIYQVLSNFGSSLVLPVFWWLLLAAVSTAVYLGEHFAFADARANRAPQSIFAAPLDLAETAAVAWRGGQPCDARDSPRKMRTFLAPAVREETNAGSEAIRLALTNGSVILDGGAEAQRRMFGCLYGLEVGAKGGVGIPIVPGTVSDWSKLQRVFSGLFISFATACIQTVSRGLPITQTAAGLPPNGRSVKASTWTIACRMRVSGPSRCGRARRCVLRPWSVHEFASDRVLHFLRHELAAILPFGLRGRLPLRSITRAGTM